MTQLVLNVENPTVATTIRRMVGLMQGVTVARTPRRKRDSQGTFLRAVKEVETGELHSARDLDDLLYQLNH